MFLLDIGAPPPWLSTNDTEKVCLYSWRIVEDFEASLRNLDSSNQPGWGINRQDPLSFFARPVRYMSLLDALFRLNRAMEPGTKGLWSRALKG